MVQKAHDPVLNVIGPVAPTLSNSTQVLATSAWEEMRSAAPRATVAVTCEALVS
jgi:hypothetical protein